MIDRNDLHAFVDGELDGQNHAVVQQQVDSSSEAKRVVAAIQQLKLLVQQNVRPPESATEWEKCVARLNEIDKRKRTEMIVSRFAPAFCGVLFVMILAVGQFGHHSNGTSISALEQAKMLSTFVPDKGPKDSSSNSLSWARALIKQSRTSTPDHLTIRGVSNGEIQGIPVKQYLVRDQKGDLAIIVIKEPVTLEGMNPMVEHPDLRAGNFSGANCVVKTQGGTTLMILADRPFEELADVASEVTVQ